MAISLKTILVLILFPMIGHSQWEQLGFEILGTEQYENIGKNISLNTDGNVFAVGSEEHNGLTQNNSGLCRVYQWSSNNWAVKGLAINGEVANENFGYNMSINSDGNTVAASSIEDLELDDNSSGCVKVYDYINGSWEQKGETLRGLGTETNFGFDINLNATGDRIAISSPLSDVVNTDAGMVQIYEWNGETWQQMGLDLIGFSEGEHFGHSISMNNEGDRIAIGAPKSAINGTNSGRALVYAWSENTWNVLGDQLIGLEPGAKTGNCVKIDEDCSILAVGSPGFNPNGLLSPNGTIKVYDWDFNENNWLQKGNDIIGIEAEDKCGENFDLSGDGTTLCSGEHRHNFSLGAVRVLKWVNNEWSQQGNTITGNQLFDRCGKGVSINRQGTKMAIGIPYSITTNNRGKMEIYENNSVGISELAESEFNAFPNPSNGPVILNIPSNETWIIRNLMGEIIKTGKGTFCDLTNEPSGIYFVNCLGKTIKLIIC